MDGKSLDESHKEVTSQEGRQRATCVEQRNPRNSAKDHAPQERRGTLNKRQPRNQEQTDTFSILCGFQKQPTRLPVHTSVCLKHSDLLNTDRMRKRDGPTAVHMKPFPTSVFNNSDRDVSSSFRATQILRQEPVHPTLWNTSVFWESTNSCPTNQD